MTVWDNIYKNYQKGGKAWATLSEGIHPLFIKFLDKSNFKTKHVLDIGCGTGKYLKFLQLKGFETDGIDSSDTAVEMTKKILNDNSNILCVDMFNFEIPKNKYDLIISVSTIHHGTKKQVQNLVHKIYEALADGGKIFITIPSAENMKRHDSYDNSGENKSGVFIPLSGPEKGLPHSFYTKEESQKLFSEFKELQIKSDNIKRWVVQASK